MRTPTKKQPDQPVTYLWERHKEVARLLLSGQRPIDICRKLGYTQSWMSILTNSPVFKEYLGKLSKRADEQVLDVQQRIKEGSEVSVDYLLDTLKASGANAVQPSLKVKIAQDFLDRAGYGKTSKIEQTTNVSIITEDRLEILKQRRAEVLSRLTGSRPILIEANIEDAICQQC